MEIYQINFSKNNHDAILVFVVSQIFPSACLASSSSLSSSWLHEKGKGHFIVFSRGGKPEVAELFPNLGHCDTAA